MICPPVLSLRAAHIAADIARLWLQLRESAQQAAGAAGTTAPAPISPSWCALNLNFPQAAYTADVGLHQQLAGLEPPHLTAAVLSLMPCPIPTALPLLGAGTAAPTASAAAAAAAPQQATSSAKARPVQQQTWQTGQQQPPQVQPLQQQQQPPARKAKSAAHANGRCALRQPWISSHGALAHASHYECSFC